MAIVVPTSGQLFEETVVTELAGKSARAGTAVEPEVSIALDPADLVAELGYGRADN